MIHFPILDQVSVEDYALYVGQPDSPGLHHQFQPGVNVIVGINGLGKTTLLNILLRAFTGPFDVPQGEELGEKRRRLVAADRSWFRRRVPDDAVNAAVTSSFFLGERYFEVKRSLANLEIISLEIDQQAQLKEKPAELEAIYQAEVTSASGLASFDDFVFLLRYVIFFLEDRRSLVWDPSAQGDVLGMLFGEQGEYRSQYVDLLNDLLSKDSEYRNMLSVVNKRKREYEKQNSTIEGGQIDMLIKQLDEGREKAEVLRKEKHLVSEERDSLRNQIENRRRDIHDERSTLAAELNNFYHSFFPEVNDAGRYLLSHFEAETGCLVCGSTDKGAAERVKSKLHMNTCPVCESPIEQGNNTAHDPFASESIEERRRNIVKFEAQLQSMLKPFQEAETRYAEVSANLVAETSKVSSLEHQLTALGDSVPDAIAKRSDIKKHLDAFESALEQIEVERLRLAEQFRAVATAIDNDVRTVSERIEATFARYISGFLAEDCAITYTTRQSRIGQRTNTESFPFPHFIPALTSGVNRKAVTPREQSQSVSESQKEFIDLAFRMAILEVAAPDAPSMLILETPEASLDSVFVPRAADLLRRFALRAGGTKDTRLIASSNVNREQMIPALFGAYPDEKFLDRVIDDAGKSSPPKVPMEERAKHVLDLLRIAAPTRALEKFRAPYEEERDRAIYPENSGAAQP